MKRKTNAYKEYLKEIHELVGFNETPFLEVLDKWWIMSKDTLSVNDSRKRSEAGNDIDYQLMYKEGTQDLLQAESEGLTYIVVFDEFIEFPIILVLDNKKKL